MKYYLDKTWLGYRNGNISNNRGINRRVLVALRKRGRHCAVTRWAAWDMEMFGCNEAMSARSSAADVEDDGDDEWRALETGYWNFGAFEVLSVLLEYSVSVACRRLNSVRRHIAPHTSNARSCVDFNSSMRAYSNKQIINQSVCIYGIW